MPRGSHWTLIYGIAGKSNCSHGSVWPPEQRADATRYAREENKYCPEHRGRGVMIARCDQFGNIDWSRVR